MTKSEKLIRKAILLVEDDIIVRDLWEALLCKQGYGVTTADDGEDAIKILSEKPFNLILTDFKMPRMDGLELVKWIRQRKIPTPIIVMTAYGDPETFRLFLEAGACDCRGKPISPKDLLRWVQKGLSHVPDKGTEESLSEHSVAEPFTPWDAFISYASEDMDFVAQLADKLKQHGTKIWYDNDVLQVGDSIRRAIEYGLANSRWGIAIVSPDYLRKEWPKKELDALFTKEANGQYTILPVLHNIGIDDIRQKHPLLADKKALSSHIGIDFLASKIALRILGKTDAYAGIERKEDTTSFQRPPEIKIEGYPNAFIRHGQEKPITDVRKYEIHFSKELHNDISNLEITKNQLLDLVNNEFKNHINYFRFDLEDYAMPLRSTFILYLDKIGGSLTLRRLAPCTRNEAKLTSWNDILALYRRATRMAYREEPAKILLVKGMFERVANLHREMRRRLEKHLQQFGDFTGSPLISDANESLKEQNHQRSAEPTSAANAEGQRNRAEDQIRFHLIGSHRSLEEAWEIIRDMDTGDVIEERAVGPLVASLEQSLQHLHKIILDFSPVE